MPSDNSIINLDNPLVYENENYSIFPDDAAPLPSNVSSGGGGSSSAWSFRTKWGSTALCVTALLVNAGHALASEAVKNADEPVPLVIYTVKDYGEVNIKITPYTSSWVRHKVLEAVYNCLLSMKGENRFLSSRWTIFHEHEPVGRIDFNAIAQPPRTCGLGLSDSSVSEEPSPESPPLASTSYNESANTSPIAKSVSSVGDDENDSNLELDCEWGGKSFDPFTEMIAPVHVLAAEPFETSDIHRRAPWVKYFVVQRERVTITTTAIDPDRHDPPYWTTYWLIKAIGRLPRAMADRDRFDWREMSVTVKVDGVAIAHISLQSGLIPHPGQSNAGGGNVSTLVARNSR